MAEHSPLVIAGRVRKCEIGNFSVLVRRGPAGDSAPVGYIADSVDADFIVRAVNSHDALVAALKAIVAFWGESGLSPCDEDECVCVDHVARAALAQAEDHKG